jgi:uncharacterized protein (DUF433 family)
MQIILDPKDLQQLPVTVDPEILGGRPVFSGTRVPVDALWNNWQTELPWMNSWNGFPPSRGSRLKRCLISDFVRWQQQHEVLLDECCPAPLKRVLTGVDVFTVEMAGLKGMKNGELIKAADGTYDVLITADKNLRISEL